MEPWAATKKSFKLVWRCQQLLFGFLANERLLRVPSLLDKGDNEVKPWAVQRFPGIYITAEESSGKPQLGDHLKAVDQSSPQIVSISFNEVRRVA